MGEEPRNAREAERTDKEGTTTSEEAAPEKFLDRVEEGVEALLAEIEALRDRVERAEDARERVTAALGEVDPDMDPAELRERLRGLSEDNRRLQDVLARAREHANRIRRRLMAVEDEL